VLWPIDRQTMSLVWGGNGYPSSPAYRDYHGLTPHHHRVWRNDGRPYDREAAQELVLRHAADFVARVVERVRDGGICVCALDTELLGHWWYEGVDWLNAVTEEAVRQELTLRTLDDALEFHDARPAPPDLEPSTWGTGGDLRTWSGPAVGGHAGGRGAGGLSARAATDGSGERALRELLALQSSDWAFLTSAGTAGEYPRERAREHARRFDEALEHPNEVEAALRNLAPDLVGWTP
jgi:1,4-alpha-glucan branching enzyme